MKNETGGLRSKLGKYGAGGGTWTPTSKALRIFLPATAFAAITKWWFCGLDYTFVLAEALDAARLVSTPSPKGLAPGLPFERFPRLWAVLLFRFPWKHSIFRFKSAAYTIPPRPHRHGYNRERVISQPPKRLYGLPLNRRFCCGYNLRRIRVHHSSKSTTKSLSKDASEPMFISIPVH